jgi:hypothetical protein
MAKINPEDGRSGESAEGLVGAENIWRGTESGIRQACLMIEPHAIRRAAGQLFKREFFDVT